MLGVWLLEAALAVVPHQAKTLKDHDRTCEDRHVLAGSSRKSQAWTLAQRTIQEKERRRRLPVCQTAR